MRLAAPRASLFRSPGPDLGHLRARLVANLARGRTTNRLRERMVTPRPLATIRQTHANLINTLCSKLRWRSHRSILELESSRNRSSRPL